MPSQSTEGRAIVLGGFMGAGKSTIGRALADRLRIPFVDTDVLIEAVHGPISEQIEQEGEAVFRAREAAILAGLSPGRQVIATGGGVFADPAHRRRLRELGWLVTLDVSLDTVMRRVGGDPGRPLLGRAAELLASRSEDYRDVDHSLDADLPVQMLVDALAAFERVAADIPVAVPGHAYRVLIRPSLRDSLGAALRRELGVERVIVVSEDRVWPLWGAAVRASLDAAGISMGEPVVLAAGEENKGLANWSRAVDGLLDRGVDRSLPVVAVGGGVLGDIAGFAASSVLRGVPWVQVPTTLLAMADSSVGGKTGVNHAAGKNLIGAFHQPRLVLAALDTLTTLEPRIARSGLAEIAKAGLIGDPQLIDILEAHGPDLARLDPSAIAAVLDRAVRVKASIVAEDAQERGRRAVLNLGHTTGHALEGALGPGALHHGEAVAIGLCAEARWAAKAGLGPPGLASDLEAMLGRLGLPTRAPPVSSERLLRASRVDKKRRGAMLRVPVCVRPGRVELVDLDVDGLPEYLEPLTRPSV